MCHVIYTWLSSLCALQAMHLKYFFPVYSCVYFLAASSPDATWLPGSAHHGAITIANWSPPTACKSQILASHHLVVVLLQCGLLVPVMAAVMHVWGASGLLLHGVCGTVN